ncbi:MAG: HEAT repeat domain-containing protein [Armatimonadetes bacterium]|nr:HEAT repeat domain-containing protein [Armatimonadota bacterium]
MSDTQEANTSQPPARKDDPRTTDELVRTALTADEDSAWRAVSVLHTRGTREVFDTARRLCESQDPKERALGADILGQLGVGQMSTEQLMAEAADPETAASRRWAFHEESVALLLDLLEHDADAAVLYSAAAALGHRHDSRAIAPLVRLAEHPSEDVRDGVVFGLLGHEDERAIQTLVELSGDADAGVRDWATFGLAQQTSADTQAIREALVRRLDDEDSDVRAEALIGLARRGERGIMDRLVRELSDPNLDPEEYGTWQLLEAAEHMADPHLCPALLRLRERWTEGAWGLDHAMQACCAEGPWCSTSGLPDPSDPSYPDRPRVRLAPTE